MNKRFLLTSNAFEGEVEFEFNDIGLLLRCDMSNATLSELQQRWILREMPKELAEIRRVLGNSPTAKFVEINEELNFEMFWNMYNDKLRSSRKKAENKWGRMHRAEQQKAYNYTPVYNRIVRSKTHKKHSETYLDAEKWNN